MESLAFESMPGMRTPRWRGAAVLVALAVATALMASGCGGGDDETTTSAAPPPNAQSEQEITAVVDDFYSDDNPAKCQTLSTKAIETMGGMDACLNNDAPATKTPHKILDITINGSEAKVHLRAGETIADVFLVYEDGAWKWDKPVPLAVQL
jgi:hypothetical protein